ncbi:GNAT family N-acetyltransferase [Paracoccus sp. S1E-3]|uniref:GNAT family N-acetyltransferase n=1 Tax=Paracoccus sp. S1E-3 TaxID=2756130 RepID=UPI0015EFB6B6|nr:GNAT family N-acetyltransferase [Paracoccus sp. S1E-3]MBA4489792.1 GNAT family N-acetyltransferase [Paracoccus sp. S1E-3]
MRVGLRAPSLEDAPLIWRAMQDPDTLRFLPAIPDPFHRQDAVDFITEIARPEDRAITVDGDFAGMIRTGGDLGYWVAPEFRGRGVLRRAAQQAIIAHFRDSDEPVRAWHLADNGASRRTLLALGFRDMGADIIRRARDGAELAARSMQLSRADFTDALEIRTPRCRITALGDADLPELHRIFTAPLVARMLLRFHSGMSLEEFAALMRPVMDPLRRRMRMAIRQDGRLIGSIGVHDGETPSIYYALAPEFAGQGLASEIVPTFCDNVQDWFGLVTLKAEVFQDNPASRRVLEKAGFRVTGTDSVASLGRAEGPSPGWLMERR